jgi:hypothetical protein
MINDLPVVILENRRPNDPTGRPLFRNFDQMPQRVGIDNRIIIQQPYEIAPIFRRSSNSEITASCKTQVFAGPNNGETLEILTDSIVERNIGSVVN